MKIRKAIGGDIKMALAIAENLKKWFTKEALKKMRRTFKKDLIIAFDKEVIGFLNYKINKKSITILWMGVKSNSRRKGIGRILVKALEKIAKKDRIKKIKVETLSYKDKYKPYKSTRNFYLKNNFEYKWIKKAKKKGYDDLVIMEKDLK